MDAVHFHPLVAMPPHCWRPFLPGQSLMTDGPRRGFFVRPLVESRCKTGNEEKAPLPAKEEGRPPTHTREISRVAS
jgi:hypothetical protein